MGETLTPKDAERLAAQAKLEQWAAKPPQLPKLSTAALKAIGLKPEREAKQFTQDPNLG